MVKISFILGILNAERTLRDCLDSILIQDYPKKNYEVIIVDGGSTDKTLEIIGEYRKNNKNIRLLHNPHKLSEGRGMSKDMGVDSSRGEIVIFLDHDNIIIGKDWLKKIIYPFEDEKVMASQSLLKPVKGDSNFLKYVNDAGVEDSFAIPYSLVAQMQMNPRKFKIERGSYYVYLLDKKNILYGGANGCAFRRSVFLEIGGYTRDVDVFASMAELNMKVASPVDAFIYHKTSGDFLSFMKKKGIYFYRFINKEYETKKFSWIGDNLSDNIKFLIRVMLNLSFLKALIEGLKQIKNGKGYFWLLHPFYVFFITLEYGLITFYKFGNFLRYRKINIR